MKMLLRRTFALVLAIALAISLGTAAFAAGGKYGDMNDDGDVNGKDITILRRYLAGGYGVTIQQKYGDINGDGDVNGKDITILRRYLAGGYGVTLPPDDVEEPITPPSNDNSTPWIPIP